MCTGRQIKTYYCTNVVLVAVQTLKTAHVELVFNGGCENKSKIQECNRTHQSQFLSISFDFFYLISHNIQVHAGSTAEIGEQINSEIYCRACSYELEKEIKRKSERIYSKNP